MFTKSDYDTLHNLVFRPDYPGYKPDVRELPNGDGKVDSGKRYAHVARKYIDAGPISPDDWRVLDSYLEQAHQLATQVAEALKVPAAYAPDIRFGALRILEYPIGAGSNEHTDFDIFTIMAYRDQPDKFRGTACRTEAYHLDPQMHIGELGELVGLGPATRHSVEPSVTPQHSIVYFAIPDHAAVLPSGLTVGEWLDERLKRSRVTT